MVVFCSLHAAGAHHTREANMSIYDGDTAHIPSTSTMRPQSALVSTANALIKLRLAQGQVIPSLREVEAASGLSDTAVRIAFRKLIAAGGVARTPHNARMYMIVDEATVAMASTITGAAQIEAAYKGATGAELGDDAGGVSPVAVSFASLAAQVEALVLEVAPLREAVQESARRAGAAEALAAALSKEVAELRARLDAAHVASLPAPPRSLPAPRTEPLPGDLDDLKEIVLRSGGQAAAASQLGVSRDVVKHALARGRVSPTLAAALRAHS